MLKRFFTNVAIYFAIYLFVMLFILFYLFVTSFFNDLYGSDYKEVINPVKEALYIQTNAKLIVDDINKRMMIKVSQLGIEKPFAVASFTYKTYKKKQLEIKNIHNPIFRETTHTLQINPKTVFLNTQWKF